MLFFEFNAPKNAPIINFKQKWGYENYRNPLILLVETAGFEPATPCMRSKRYRSLSYSVQYPLKQGSQE